MYYGLLSEGATVRPVNISCTKGHDSYSSWTWISWKVIVEPLWMTCAPPVTMCTPEPAIVHYGKYEQDMFHIF